MNNTYRNNYLPLLAILLVVVFAACKHRKVEPAAPAPVVQAPVDSLGKCKMPTRNGRTLTRLMKENELKFKWLSAKAEVFSVIDGKEESFDIRVALRKDSAMLITIQYVLGVQVAKILITRDSVKFVDYIHRNYFKGDFVYLSDLLNADIDFDVAQAVLFGNSAEFNDDEGKLNPTTDRENCKYLLSTARKRKLRRIQQGAEIKDALQTVTLSPDNFKILRNVFVEPANNRSFTADYSSFATKDSVFAPWHVDIDISAEKKATVKIEYVRMEKDVPQKLSLNIPGKYEQVQIRKK